MKNTLWESFSYQKQFPIKIENVIFKQTEVGITGIVGLSKRGRGIQSIKGLSKHSG